MPLFSYDENIRRDRRVFSLSYCFGSCLFLHEPCDKILVIHDKFRSQNSSYDVNLLDGFLQKSIKRTGCFFFLFLFLMLLLDSRNVPRFSCKNKQKGTKRQPQDRLNPFYREKQIDLWPWFRTVLKQMFWIGISYLMENSEALTFVLLPFLLPNARILLKPVLLHETNRGFPFSSFRLFGSFSLTLVLIPYS